MRKQILIIAVGMLSLLAYKPAFAAYGSSGGMSGFVINPGVSYSSQTDDDGTPNGVTTSKKLAIDAKVDYMTMSGFYFGGIYTSDSFTLTNGNTTNNGTLTGYGPLVGYNHNGFYVDLSYYLSSTYQNAASQVTYKTGTGFGIGLGYLFYFEKFFVGPSFSYKALTYTTKDPNNVSLTNNYKYSDIVPYLQFGVMF